MVSTGLIPNGGSEHDATTSAENQGQSIAIIGMGCRLPGGCSSPQKLWDLLYHGKSSHCEAPKWRYNAEGFYQPQGERPGAIGSTGGHFIQEDVRNFQNSFFNINNLEATHMDSQQRKLLEVVFECFESAGYSLQKVSGTDVGCYIGNFALDCPVTQLSDPEYVHKYTAAGATPTILANRISHVFNLVGPSVTLDTACSSSLYALHIACNALETRDCSAAIVAAANLIQSPQYQMVATKAGILSKTSTCHTFDASADGYGRSEGVGALFLKRYEDAIRDGDPIRAVIRGTAANSNGRTNGIMLPSSSGQEAVIRKAYAKAGLPLDQTDYVEAHGTGTPVGDPIEVEAISRAFAHESGTPTLVGSVKTNLGHSEAASGLSSVIKSVLALENMIIPPTIGIERINPKISQADLNIDIVQTIRRWPTTLNPRVSVNSFGFGGANSHAILEAPPGWNHKPSFASNSTDDFR